MEKDRVHPLIENRRAEILALAERHGVRDVRVSGSMATWVDADAGSDVDLLVSLAPGRTGLAFGALPEDVELLLGTSPGRHRNGGRAPPRDPGPRARRGAAAVTPDAGADRILLEHIRQPVRVTAREKPSTLARHR